MVEPPPFIVTNIPQRMDRLPWSNWHWLVVSALGVTWLLDGLEVSIVAALGPVLTHPTTLALTESEVGLAASAYLAGSVIGALVFSYLTDRQGRKKWFMITLLLYLAATILTAFAWDLTSLMCFRFLTGAGIGGEYAAINSAIDELIPARRRGHTDLAINGTWWLGSATGALLSVVLLNPRIIPEWLGWRLCFIFGAVLGIAIVLVRRFIPESPRWLMTHSRIEEAEEIVTRIERQVSRDEGLKALPEARGSITVRTRPHGTTIGTVARELFQSYPRRTVLGLALMITQSFMYNAVSFSFPFVLTKYYDVPTTTIGLYLLPFALGNFLGPLLLGRFFDTIGRKQMISFTYAVAGVLLAADRVPVLDRLVYRDHAPIGLVVDLLFCLGRRQRRLPDGQRDLPDGNPRHGDRFFLHGGARGGHYRPLALRPDDRNVGHECVLRLSAWSWIDAGGRCGGAHTGRQGRRPFVGTDRRSLIGTADHRGYVVRRLIRSSSSMHLGQNHL